MVEQGLRKGGADRTEKGSAMEQTSVKEVGRLASAFESVCAEG